MKTWSWPRTRVLMVLSVLGLLVYFNAVAHPFVHDDLVFIQMNPNIGRWDNLIESFLVPGVPLQSLKITTPYYRPLLEIFYRFQYLLFGMNPAGYHLFNILLHILNAFLVYLLALRLQITKKWAFAVAVIFLVHPVQSEAVACVSGISNLIVTGLILGMLLAYWESRLRRGWQKPAWQAFALALFTMALLSKEQAIIAPALILLFEVLWPESVIQQAAGATENRRLASTLVQTVRHWLFPAAFCWLAGMYLAWRMFLFSGFFSEALQNPGELVLRLWAIPKTLLMYVGLMLWPAGLHYYRSVDILSRNYVAVCGFVAGTLFILAACLSMPDRYRRWAWFGLAWFLVSIVPVLNIVPLINEYSLILAAEHFLYLPIIGFLIFLAAVVGWLITTLGSQMTLRFQRLLFGLVVVVFGALTLNQNNIWRGEVPLFENTLKYESGLGRVHLLLGKAYAKENRFRDALAKYSTGLQIMQGYVKKSHRSKAMDVYLYYVKVAYYERGECYLAVGNLARSTEEFLASLATHLSFAITPETTGQDSITASNLGLNFIRQGNREEAKKYFELAIQLDGRNCHALNNLGMWFLGSGDKKEARFWFERALKVDPRFLMAWQNLKKLDSFDK